MEAEKSNTDSASSPRFDQQKPTPLLTRQLSQKSNCLCSPTNHAGSFRCRRHRTSLKRSSMSYGSALSELANTKASPEHGSPLRAANHPPADTDSRPCSRRHCLSARTLRFARTSPPARIRSGDKQLKPITEDT
ncbi:uncharacterized protein A4U43_C01F5300 [Asparagus officinalis]|uniref:Uncharacterized protein n=1 Tax=Asparagus officinalis TaxID=4686 RepID=A0A5P1FNN3_ASPOF|nr:uncharacterized protein A4U43_C01F5300 [Asparagus officinalis]